MEDKRQCDGHCENCNINQRTYCAAQISYYNQKEIAEIKASLQKGDIAVPPTILNGEKSQETEQL